MTTYLCKCGRTFQKNTEAATTGLRMPDYGPDHECYGCPFLCNVMTWDPITQQNAVQNHECRGSKSIRYETAAALSLGDKCVGRVYSLDFEFLHHVRNFADSLEGIEPDRYAFSDRPADYGDDGRFKLTIYPAQNNKGIAAKKKLFETFFNPDGSRKDVTPEQEKEIVLNQIKEAKALAQGKSNPSGTAYIHGSWRYFVDQRENGGKFTAFMSSDEFGGNMKTEVTGIGDFDTAEQAQNALDGFALKRRFEAERFTPEEKIGMVHDGNDATAVESSDSVLNEGNTPEAEPGNDSPEIEDDESDTGDDANETPDSEDDPGDSENDGEGGPPCDWKNASGEDEDGGEPEEEEPEEVDGEPLSLRGPEFDTIVSTADSVLNRLVAILHEKKQRDGEMTVKVTFEDLDGMGVYNFSGAVSGKINYTVKPQKVVGDAVELKFDAHGNPIIPADREHQLNFDEIQPGQREIPPSGGTAVVDGQTGIIEGYQDNETEDFPESDPEENEESDFQETGESQDEEFPSFEEEDNKNQEDKES